MKNYYFYPGFITCTLHINYDIGIHCHPQYYKLNTILMMKFRHYSLWALMMVLISMSTNAQEPYSISQQWTIFGFVDEEAVKPKYHKHIPETLPAENGGKAKARKIQAKKLKKDHQYMIDFEQVFSSFHKDALCYAYTTITAGKKTNLRFGAGADWFMVVYVNGKEVYATIDIGNQTDDFAVHNNIFDITLNKGENVVLFKVFSGMHGWLLHAGIPDQEDIQIDQNKIDKWYIVNEPLPSDIQRKNDDYPLSDQDNSGEWKKYEPLWDEFESGFNAEKWNPIDTHWTGRVSKFYENNVQVYDGMLHILCKKEKHPRHPEAEYTAGNCNSKQLVKYGYFEIKAKPMASAASSAFWLYHNDNKNFWWTEIDVFEIGGASKKGDQAHRYNMCAHKFKLPEEKPEQKHLAYHSHWISPEPLRDDFHVYGLEWNAEEIIWYFDGNPVYKLENRYWHQPLRVIFDTEIFVNWFGHPKDEELPGDFQVKYIRAWKQNQ